jgi:hypothetical protein
MLLGKRFEIFDHVKLSKIVKMKMGFHINVIVIYITMNDNKFMSKSCYKYNYNTLISRGSSLNSYAIFLPVHSFFVDIFEFISLFKKQLAVSVDSDAACSLAKLSSFFKFIAIMI